MNKGCILWLLFPLILFMGCTSSRSEVKNITILDVLNDTLITEQLVNITTSEDIKEYLQEEENITYPEVLNDTTITEQLINYDDVCNSAQGLLRCDECLTNNVPCVVYSKVLRV